MNIHLIINRGLVYSILTVFTVSVYFAVIESVRKLFAGLVTGRDFIVTAAGVFLAALAFQPAHEDPQRRSQEPEVPL